MVDEEPIKEGEMDETDDGFRKFERLLSAIKIQQSTMEELEKAFRTKKCPLTRQTCMGMECAWYMICLHWNRSALHELIT